MGKYQTYLDGDDWKAKRRSTLARVKSRKSNRSVFQCEQCKEFFHSDAMQVHHQNYDRIGRERPQDLSVLCRWCHAELHGKTDFVLLAVNDKKTYRAIFNADRKDMSDGEMNYFRNALIAKLAEIEHG